MYHFKGCKKYLSKHISVTFVKRIMLNVADDLVQAFLTKKSVVFLLYRELVSNLVLYTITI